MNVTICNATITDQVWPTFSKKLQKACEKTGGDIGSGELWQMCRSGQAFLIVVHDDNGFKAAIIVQFQRWISKTVLRCLAIVGEDMDSWLPSVLETVQKMAKDGGATSFVAEGREGWAKVFPKAKKLRVTYEAELDDGQ